MPDDVKRRDFLAACVGAGGIATAGVNLQQSGVNAGRKELELLSRLKLNKQVDSIENLGKAWVVLSKGFQQTTPQIEKSFSRMISVSKAHAIDMSSMAAPSGYLT